VSKHTVQMTKILAYGNCRAKRRTCLHKLRGKFASELWPEFTFFFFHMFLLFILLIHYKENDN